MILSTHLFCLLNLSTTPQFCPPLLLTYTFDVLNHIRQHNQLNTIRLLLCTIYYARFTMRDLLCLIYYTRLTMSDLLCTMHYALCTMHYDLSFYIFFLFFFKWDPHVPFYLFLYPFQPRNNLFFPGFNFIYLK